MTRPFDLHAFRCTEIGQLAVRSIEANALAIIDAADQGLAPLTAIIPELEGLINERLDWVRIDWLIRDWLAADFEVTARIKVPTRLPHKGFRYVRRV